MTDKYLTKEQMNQLSNLLPTLHSLKPVIEILNTHSKAQFYEIQDTLKEVLKDFNKQEEEFDDEINDYYNKLMEENGFKTFWAVDANELNLQQIKQLFTKKHKVVKSISYKDIVVNFKKSTKMNNLQLWKEANQIILSSGDLHHVFIEDFISDDGHLTLHTGS